MNLAFQVITFECRVTLLLLAWILSMILAWLVLLCHFLFWCCTFRRPNADVQLFEEGAAAVTKEKPTKESETSQLLDEIVTEEFAERTEQLISKEHKKED